MKTITKKQIKDGIYFTYKNSESTTIYQLGGEKGAYYLNSYILFSDKISAIDSNNLSVSSLTGKYLTCWDIHFGKKRVYKVALSDLAISDVQNFKSI